MKFEVKDFDYTREMAFEEAKKYFRENGNKKTISKILKHLRLSDIITYADEYNVKYSDVEIIACSESVEWEDYEESFFEINFDVEMSKEELEKAIKEKAEKLYNDSGIYYKTEAFNILSKQLQNQLNHSVTKEI